MEENLNRDWAVQVLSVDRSVGWSTGPVVA